MSECDCGEEITAKNAAGHYREQCQQCIRQVARDANKHVHVCEKSDCGVCRSWREERDAQARDRFEVADYGKVARYA